MTPTPTPTPQSTLKFAFRLSGKWGYKDEQGAVKIEAQFSDALPFVEGLAFAAMTNDGKTQYGVIDDKGAWVVSPSYDEVRSYCEDLAAVKIAEKWGYIDTAGTMGHHAGLQQRLRFQRRAGPRHPQRQIRLH